MSVFGPRGEVHSFRGGEFSIVLGLSACLRWLLGAGPSKLRNTGAYKERHYSLLPAQHESAYIPLLLKLETLHFVAVPNFCASLSMSLGGQTKTENAQHQTSQPDEGKKESLDL